MGGKKKNLEKHVPPVLSPGCDSIKIASTDLDSFGRLQRLLRRNPHLSLPQQLLDEVRDVPPGDGDVLDAAADDVALSLEDENIYFLKTYTTIYCHAKLKKKKKKSDTNHWDDVCDSVSTVDHSPRQCSLTDLPGRPGRSQRQHSLIQEAHT